MTTQALTANLNPDQDNTIFEPRNLSSGVGPHLFAGRSFQGVGSDRKRALLRFDLSSIPAGATITSVSLAMTLNRSVNSGTTNVALHPALQAWGEGTSSSGGLSGVGAPATVSDASWECAFDDGGSSCIIFWNVPGGDFAPSADATLTVDSALGAKTWASTAALVSTVQSWVDTPAQNFGWFVLGDESAAPTAKRFDSREGTTPPVLTVEYSIPACPDVDGDTFTDAACGGTDCDDGNPNVFPGATELPCDGVDNNCDTNIDETRQDWDGDTFDECVDCNDGDPSVNPAAQELPCDSVDNNCDGNIDENRKDADSDGFHECVDCDDGDPTVNPAAQELPCDNVDNNCDFNIDENRQDVDGDTFDECVDCNDGDPNVSPAAPELPCDNVDNNCNSNVDENRQDVDGDTFDECVDCNDGDPNVFPGAPEVCDGADNNCDSVVDDGLAFTDYYPDADDDGFGDGSTPPQSTCDGAPAGTVTDNSDCDDGDPNNFPGNPEVCDGADNNCDAVADDGLPLLDYYPDADGDGFGDSATIATPRCEGEYSGYVLDNTDCDDSDAARFPGNLEQCGDVDQDCDGNASTGAVTFAAAADAAIFEESENASGAGALFVGLNNQGNARRSLIRFAVADDLAGAEVTEATLRLHVEQTNAGDAPASLHALTAPFGEGTAIGGGSGAPASAGDATWLCALADGAGACTEAWSSAGGDFQLTADANFVLAGIGSTAEVTNSDVTGRVQAWVDAPLSNAGWIVLGDEDNNQSAKRILSRESGSDGPSLMVRYSLARDDDGDGASICTDCDDNDPNVGPDMAEVECDGVDNDCDPDTADDPDDLCSGNAWTCAPELQGGGDGCHCGCGEIDPDCVIAAGVDFGADACDAAPDCEDGVDTADPTLCAAPIDADAGTLDEDGGVVPEEDGGVVPGADGGVTPGADSGVAPGADSGVAPSEDSGVAPSEDSGVAPGADGGVIPGADSGVGGDSDGGSPDDDDESAACRCDAGSETGGGAPGSLLALLGLAAVLGRRRTVR